MELLYDKTYNIPHKLTSHLRPDTDAALNSMEANMRKHRNMQDLDCFRGDVKAS